MAGPYGTDVRTGAPSGARARASFAIKSPPGTPREQDSFWLTLENVLKAPVSRWEPLKADGRTYDTNDPYFGEYFYQTEDGGWRMVDEEQFKLPGDAADLTGPAIPFATTTAAGTGATLAATPSGPVGMAGAGATGTALGKGFGDEVRRNVGRQLGVVDPRSGPQITKDTAVGMGQEAAADLMFGVPAGAVAKRVMSPGTGTFSKPKQKEFLADAQEFGMTGRNRPLPATATQSGPVARVQGALENTTMGSGPILERQLGELQGLRKALDKIVPPGGVSATQVGQAVGERIDDIARETTRMGKKAYDGVRKVVRRAGFDFGSQLDKNGNWVDGVFHDTFHRARREMAAPETSDAIVDMHSRITRFVSHPQLGWDNVQRFLSMMRGKVRAAKQGQAAIGDAEVRQMKNILRTFEGDLSRFFRREGPAAWDQWRLADKFWRTEAGQLKTKFAQQLFREGQENPAGVVHWIFNAGPRKRMKHVTEAKKLLGDDVWNVAVSNWLEESLFKKARVGLQGNFLGEVKGLSPSQLTNAVEKYGEDFLSAVMGRAGYRRLKRFADFVGKFQAADKLTRNASGTGKVMISYQEHSRIYQSLLAFMAAATGGGAGKFAGGDLMGAAGGVAGAVGGYSLPYFLAKSITSKGFGRWWMREAGTASKAVGQAARAATRGGAVELNERRQYPTHARPEIR